MFAEESKIKNYPEYGTQYATIEIPKIDVNLPVYFGDTLEILKNGVGHSSGSYFPGEGGSIIYMGHNSKKVFRRFSELQKGNEIIVKANYGEYKYIFDALSSLCGVQARFVIFLSGIKKARGNFLRVFFGLQNQS